MKMINLGEGVELALDELVTSTNAILAQKRKGKTYTAMVLAEGMLAAGQQIVVIDPTDAWWGLRSSADGLSAGYPIHVLGGRHADVPLEPTAGEMVAEAIVEQRFSAIICVREMRKGERVRFLADFMETFYRVHHDAVVHMFIDEADISAPQMPRDPNQARLLGATDELVRRGGIDGVGITLISQRPQVLNKDVLSQIDRLIALRMMHPKDLAAVKDWIADNVDAATGKAMLASLPSLPKGVAWVWSPGDGTFAKVAVRRKSTFDSGATPKAGQRIAPPKVLAPVDLARLGESIAATLARAKENDPKVLRAEVGRLQARVTELELTGAPVRIVPDAAAVADAYGAGQAEGVRIATAPIDELKAELVARVDAMLARIHESTPDIITVTSKHGDLVRGPAHKLLGEAHRVPPGTPRADYVIKRTGVDSFQLGVPGDEDRRTDEEIEMDRKRAHAARPNTPGSISKGQRLMLVILRRMKRTMTKTEIGTLAMYSPTSSTTRIYLADLATRGMVERAGDTYTLTSKGSREVDHDWKTMTVLGIADRVAEWARGEGARGSLLRALTDSYPRFLTKPDLEKKTEYSAASSTMRIYLGELRKRGLVVRKGKGAGETHMAAPALFIEVPR